MKTLRFVTRALSFVAAFAVAAGSLVALSAPSVRAAEVETAAVAAAPIVVTTDIVGNSRVETSAIRIHISQPVGQALDEALVDEDIRSIYGLGFFSLVWATTEIDEDGARLIYHVREQPYVETVDINGVDKLEFEDIEALVGIRPRTIFDPKRAFDGVAAVRDAYAKEGYPDADVRYDLDVFEDNTAELTYEIDEGGVVRVQKIRFEGVDAFSHRKLRRVMATREEWFMSWFTGAGTLNDEELRTDVERLQAFYYDSGYIHVRIDEPEVVRIDDGLELTVRIEEGPKFSVGEVTFEGDVLLDEGDLAATTGIEIGKTFKPSLLRDGVFRLTEAYGNLGYAFAEVTPLTKVDDATESVSVRFRMESGPTVKVGRIDVRGNTKTRDYVVRREMRLKEGQKFSGTGLRQSRNRVRRLGFFEEVDVTSARADKEDEVDLTVSVREARTGTFSAGAGFSSADNVLANARIVERNLFGRGQSLQLGVDFGSRRRNFRISFTEPWFLGIPLSASVDLFDSEFRFSRFTRGGTGMGLGLSYPLWELGWRDFYGFSLDDVHAGIRYRLERTRVDGVSLFAPPSLQLEEGKRLTSSIRPSLIRNTIDHPFDPTRGSRQAMSLEWAGLGGDTDFLKFEASTRFYFPLVELESRRNLVYSFAARLGYGVGDTGVSGEELPATERYFPGGINSVRGFDSRTLGPREQVCEPPFTGSENEDTCGPDEIGGSQQLIFNNELIFGLFPDAGLKGVAFFDAGEAFTAEEGISFGELRLAVGWGIRWLSPFGPVRIAVGYPLKREEDEDSSVILFSFGTPF